MSPSTKGVWVLVVVILLGGAARGETGTVAGIVQVTVPQGRPFAMPGVSVTLTCGTAAAATVITDEQGAFSFTAAPVGSCVLLTDIQGFKSTTIALDGATADRFDVLIPLELETLYTGLTVTSAAGPGSTRRRHTPNPAPKAEEAIAKAGRSPISSRQ